MFAKIKTHFTNWREWEFNPIVIKELRQSVRSWAVTGMLLLFLTILFLTSLAFLIGQSFSVNLNEQLGGTIFQAFVVILAAASFLFIPLYLGVRVAVERQDNNPDLLYISTLSPGRIIRGKLFCGAYMALLFFSACMPFMAFTNLLRGVDLPTVFFILFFLFLTVCAANQLAIFLACLPMSRPFKILIALGGFIFSFSIIVPAIATSMEMMRSGIGTMMASRQFWMTAITTYGSGFALTGLFYFLSVALISPPSANRALPVRIYITVIWLAGALLSIAWVWQTAEPQVFSVWTIITFILSIFALLVTISNSDQISARVRVDIPKNKFKRIFAFLFFNGAAGGLVWLGILVVATFLICEGVFLMGTVRRATMTAADISQFFTASIAIMAYVFAYALTALFIHRKFLPKRQPKIAGLLAVLLAAFWAIAPSIVMFFLNQLSWKSVENLQLGNIFNVFSIRDTSERFYHLIFALFWLALMIALNAKWFLQQIKNFRPNQKIEVPPVLAEISRPAIVNPQ